jgi:hypothetical protein
VWIKIIDVHSGVIIDIEQFGLGDVSGLATNITQLISKAAPGGKPRQFIALRPLVDMNRDASFEGADWPGRLTSLIEKHFHAAGYGVVEFAAVMPLFEERRLESVGLTGRAEQRVPLQAAFWLVDGGCAWVSNSTEQLKIALRVQEVGGKEQRINLTSAPDRRAEAAVLDALEKALANRSQGNADETANAESELLARRGNELATRSSPFDRGFTFYGGRGLEAAIRYGQDQERHRQNRRDFLANYQRMLLLDPTNLDAKVWLGMGLLGDEDSAERERGRELLQEVIAANDPRYLARAQGLLSNAQQYAQLAMDNARQRLPSYDLAGLEKAVAANDSDMVAKYNLGALLLRSLSGSDQARGRKLLMEVAASDQADLASRARELLPASISPAPRQK